MEVLKERGIWGILLLEEINDNVSIGLICLKTATIDRKFRRDTSKIMYWFSLKLNRSTYKLFHKLKICTKKLFDYKEESFNLLFLGANQCCSFISLSGTGKFKRGSKTKSILVFVVYWLRRKNCLFVYSQLQVKEFPEMSSWMSLLSC